MVRVQTVAICLALALIHNLVDCAPEGASLESNVAVTVVQNLTEFLEQNPKAKLLQELEKELLPAQASLRLQIVYKVGNRISGDRLLATASGNQSWTTPQDVTQSLSYPKSGTGAVVTCVRVTVDQSTNLGRGYVTSGGIGQRQITIVIEAKQTLYFRYSAEIYGY